MPVGARRRGCGATGIEVSGKSLRPVTFYSRADTADPGIRRGKRLFHEDRCSAGHAPSHVTHRLENRPEHSFQLIWPYGDFLLHDMGAGLAEGLPAGSASGAEWRPPSGGSG